MDESDQSLADRSRLGDRGAFEQLVRRTGRLVFARLYLDTANAHEAEDLTQETLLVAWRNIHRLSDSAAFRGWVLSIANSVHLDAIKRQSRKKRGKCSTAAMDHLAGSDYDTISRQLGLSNGSLRGLLHRGLEMLREKMKEP